MIDNEFYTFLKISKLSNAIQEHQLNNNEVDVCMNIRQIKPSTCLEYLQIISITNSRGKKLYHILYLIVDDGKCLVTVRKEQYININYLFGFGPDVEHFSRYHLQSKISPVFLASLLEPYLFITNVSSSHMPFIDIY